MKENGGEHILMKEKRSKEKSGKVRHDGERSDEKWAGRPGEGGGDWRQQTVNEDQTKVNEDKLGEGKEKRMQEEEGGELEEQQGRIEKQRKGVCVCAWLFVCVCWVKSWFSGWG